MEMVVTIAISTTTVGQASTTKHVRAIRLAAPASAIKVLLRGNDFRADQQSSIDNVPNIVH